MKQISSFFKHILIAVALLLPITAFAFDGDMDEYHEFKEDLALVRDTYIQALNISMEEKGDKANPSWNDIEFELPELKYVVVKELPGGFKISGKHGAYKLDAEVRISPNENDFRYVVKHLAGSNAPGKEIAGEVFK